MGLQLYNPPMTVNEVAVLLREAQPLRYCPNFGNLGDLLIAEGTRQFFVTHGIPYEEVGDDSVSESHSLVYAGGARFTSNWCTEESIDQLLQPRTGRCIILPHSINGVDSMMKRMGANCHVICREQPSYDYCKNSGTNAYVYLADDMAFNLDLDALHPASLQLPKESLNAEEAATCHLLKSGLAKRMAERVIGASVVSTLGGQRRRVAFLLRNDSERAFAEVSPLTYDISVAWLTSGRKMRYNANMLLAFRDAVRRVDVVVTDRLHVAIMCYKAGVEVYMLDNSYHKLSGVYKQSLTQVPTVHLLENGLTPELLRAWRKLNAPHRLLQYRLQQYNARLKPLKARIKGKIRCEWNRLCGKKKAGS